MNTDSTNLHERTANHLVYEFEDGKLNVYEIDALLDESATFSDNGKLQLNPDRLSLLSLFAHTLKTHVKFIGYLKNVLTDNRWQAIRHTITIHLRKKLVSS
jgi:hypothetical protein